MGSPSPEWKMRGASLSLALIFLMVAATKASFSYRDSEPAVGWDPRTLGSVNRGNINEYAGSLGYDQGPARLERFGTAGRFRTRDRLTSGYRPTSLEDYLK